MDMATIKSGWLTKKGHFIRNWKKRFVVLTSESLAYYTDASLTNKRGEFSFVNQDLSKICVSSFPDTNAKPYRFAIQNNDTGGYLILCALDSQEKKQWVGALERFLRHDHVGVVVGVQERTEKEKDEQNELSIMQQQMMAGEQQDLKRQSDAESFFLAADSSHEEGDEDGNGDGDTNKQQEEQQEPEQQQQQQQQDQQQQQHNQQQENLHQSRGQREQE